MDANRRLPARQRVRAGRDGPPSAFRGLPGEVYKGPPARYNVEHAVIKVRQPQNMLLAKPSPKRGVLGGSAERRSERAPRSLRCGYRRAAVGQAGRLRSQGYQD